MDIVIVPVAEIKVAVLSRHRHGLESLALPIDPVRRSPAAEAREIGVAGAGPPGRNRPQAGYRSVSAWCRMRTYKVIDSPIGKLTLVATHGVLRGLFMEAHTHRPDPGTFGEHLVTGFEAIEEQLKEYFAGRRTWFTVPTAAAGTGFQRRLWDLLTHIPHDETRTYGQLADAIGSRSFSRAVGAENGRNPSQLSIVPCHRLIGSDGSLTEYAGGLERKRYLLCLEAVVAARTQTLF